MITMGIPPIFYIANANAIAKNSVSMGPYIHNKHSHIIEIEAKTDILQKWLLRPRYH